MNFILPSQPRKLPLIYLVTEARDSLFCLWSVWTCSSVAAPSDHSVPLQPAVAVRLSPLFFICMTKTLRCGLALPSFLSLGLVEGVDGGR